MLVERLDPQLRTNHDCALFAFLETPPEARPRCIKGSARLIAVLNQARPSIGYHECPYHVATLTSLIPYFLHTLSLPTALQTSRARQLSN